jgi:hypothetical protein
MNRVPIPYEPTNLNPCYTLRSRREVFNKDLTNSRLTEHWQTDAPALQYSLRDVSGTIWYLDMNPTASRLYRENLLQSQPFVVPSANSSEVRETVKLEQKIKNSLSTIQSYQFAIPAAQKDTSPAGKIKVSTLKGQLAESQDTYKLLLTEQKQIAIDTLADNPYFDKYDVAGDSRNIVREMRTAVTEDIVDRGVRESRRLLQREFENRWVPANHAKTHSYDTLDAYELMRPKFTDMRRTYK